MSHSSNQLIIIEDTHTWQLSGELSFNTVSALLTAMTQQSVAPQILDLQAVTRTDSAGLALLIELRRRFNRFTIQNIPTQMLALAKVSGVDSLL